MQVPLEIEEAPFRDLGDPLLRHLRRITTDPDTVAVVLMPELVSGARRGCSTTSGRSTSSACSSSSPG